MKAFISDLVEEKMDKELSHRTLNNDLMIHDKKTDITLTMPYNAIVNKVREWFVPYIYSLEMHETQRLRYWYNPKILSYDIYGTTEYWSIILYINECASMLDFEPTYVRLIDPTKIREVVNELIILNDL